MLNGCSTGRAPLAYFVLETDLTAQHVQGIAAVMESAQKTLEAGRPLKHSNWGNS
jgi:hypothetical protein